MKKYENPMLQVISIRKNDIITGSNFGLSDTEWTSGDALLAPGRRMFDEWYEGY